jgi:hypothetical protein
MQRFEALGVPADICALLAKAPLLKGESKEDYFAFVAGLFESHSASNRIEFMGLIRAADCFWEIKRLEEARAHIIAHWEPIARLALVKDHAPEAHGDIERLLAEQYPGGIDTPLLNGRAIILAGHKNQLAYLDREIASRQTEYDKILQSLASWRAMFPRSKEAR